MKKDQENLSMHHRIQIKKYNSAGRLESKTLSSAYGDSGDYPLLEKSSLLKPRLGSMIGERAQQNLAKI
jgi:hypothetical protein